MKISTRHLIQAALIAAVYAALTLFLKPYAFGPVQLRLPEVLTVLPAIFPASIPGLFVGCLLANWLGGLGLADIVFGSLATLMAAFCTRMLRKSKFFFPLPPVVFNAVIVGAYVYLLYDKTYPMPLTMLFIGLSEFLLCYGLGLPLISFIRSNAGLRRSLHIED